MKLSCRNASNYLVVEKTVKDEQEALHFIEKYNSSQTFSNNIIVSYALQ